MYACIDSRRRRHRERRGHEIVALRDRRGDDRPRPPDGHPPHGGVFQCHRPRRDNGRGPARRAAEAKKLLREGSLPVLADPECACREELAPDALVDAILAKRNLGTKIDDAPIVVGVGPGFTAGEDCHAVVETMRGHTLGRVIYSGSALPNTNIPGLIGGFAGERVLRAPCDGIFTAVHRIGDTVEEGETIGFVEGQPMKCTISGVLRGVLDNGVPVKKGMKSGDVDPRCKPEYCTTISDKALAVGGGVVEAVLYLRAKAQGRR